MAVLGILFLYGLGSGWTTPATQLLLQPDTPIPVNNTILTWLSVVTILAEIISVIILGVSVEKMGRRNMLLWSIIIQTIGWILLVVDITSLTLLIISTFVQSIGLAIFDVIGYTYLGEICSPRNRGIFSAVSLFIYTIGIEAQFVVGLFGNYTLLAVVPIVFCPVVLLASYCTCLESPYHLIMEGHNEEAMKVVSTLYSGENPQQIAARFEDLQRYAIEETIDGIGFLTFLLLPSNLKICLFLFFVNSVLYISAHWVFFTYGPVMMQPYSDELNIGLVINISGVILLVCCALSSFVVDLASRRFLLLSGFLLLSVLQLALAALYYIENNADTGIPGFAQSMVVLMMAVIVVFVLTVYPTVHILRAEVFPHALKIQGNCLLNVFKMMASLVCSGLFFPIADFAGVGSNFVLYAIAAALAALYVYLYYKETKGMTLTEVRRCYKN